jgi:uncharacterized protein (DUF1330 family)
MSVYMIIDIEVIDPEMYAKYVEKVPPIIKTFGGRYLARGGKITPLSSDWDPERIILLEFPSSKHITRWLMSKEQIPLDEIRRRSTNSKAVIVEGCSPDLSDT